ncbi:hypothetical protein [uncultured Kordia sp.]|uniref:hypothetical protein n=1 Tax=uncultured Kordia sp. TaxID=507699 RepID=UPI00262E269F|nr:hypothetical protein [uncultured Kordia sp.]
MKKRNVKNQLFLNKEIISRQMLHAVVGGINDLDNDDEDEDVRVNTHVNICEVKNERHN